MVATAKPLTVYRLADGRIVTTGDADRLMLEQPDGSLVAWVYPVHGVETIEGSEALVPLDEMLELGEDEDWQPPTEA
jgi:hypothetical protein